MRLRYHFALLAVALYASPAARAGDPLSIRPIHLASGTVRGDEFPDPIRVRPGHHHLVQFARMPTGEDKAALASLGVTLLGYLPERSFWARITVGRAAVARLEVAGGVVFARPASGKTKMHAALDPGEQGLVSGGRMIQVAVHWFGDATGAERARTAATMAAFEQIASGAPSYVVLELPANRIEALAAHEAV